MFEFVSWILGKKPKPRSKDLAKERLKLVLTHDRVDTVSYTHLDVYKRQPSVNS